MVTEASSLDDILTGAGTNAHQPTAPENVYDEQDVEPEAPETEPEVPEPEDEAPEAEPGGETDDYGNEKPKPKTYTEDEVNERINKAVRDRLARMQKNDNITPQQAKNAEQNFEYDPNAAGDWQQQLKQFVKQTYQETIQEEQTRAQQMREQQAQAEFEVKFHQGMGKFSDFTDVVSQQPITDAMTMATRAMKDPAAFLYAASKRHGAELQRIAQLDPYTQMVEMGRLEERMKKAKTGTNAPRPVSRTQGDTGMPHKSDREPTIEELIAKAEAKKRAAVNARRR
jgi:hypothetical protein